MEISVQTLVWWILANLVALSFAIFSWSGCYYLFNFPEIPRNFEILQQVGRVGKVQAFTPLTAPATSSASPEELYELFYTLSEEKIAEFNKMLLRGYITNYEKIPVYRYLSGEFRILEVRALTEEDIISPGLMIQARAFVKSDKNEISSPYPMVVDYLIPTDATDAIDNFQAGDLFQVKKSLHCGSILHVKKEGRKDDPTLKCVVVPLAYNVYITPDRQELTLTPPSKINISAPLPPR